MNLVNPPQNSFSLFLRSCLIGLGALFAFFFVFLLIAMIGSENVSEQTMLKAMQSRNNLIIIQIASMIGMFILPPVIFAKLSKNNFWKTFQLDSKIEWKKYGLAILFVFSLFPFMLFLSHTMECLPLPEALKTLAEEQKINGDKTMSLLLDSPSFANFVLMFLMVGVGAGITEELFFRGLFLPLLAKHANRFWIGFIAVLICLSVIKNSFINGVVVLSLAMLLGYLYQQGSQKHKTWIAIILSSAAFSMLHLSVYNFIPILLIGILFSYLYLKTGDLKLNIFIHSLFNGFQVVLNYLFQVRLIEQDIDKIETFPIYVAIPCLGVAILLFKLMTKSNEYVSH